MTDCVALLRGINVGKSKRIAMADLRSLLEGLGHANVRTLLNSGNAVFEAKRGDAMALAKAIEKAIAGRFGFPVAVVVVTATELRSIVKENRLRQADKDPSRFLVAFARPGALGAAKALVARSWAPDALALGNKAAYLWCASGLIESKLAKAFAKATGETATTRNWATVLKLQAMLANAQAD